VQGQDELSQIKKKRGRTGQEGEGIQCTFIQYFFLRRLLVETLWVGKQEPKENKAEEWTHGSNQNTRIITQDRVKHKTEKNEKKEAREDV